MTHADPGDIALDLILGQVGQELRTSVTGIIAVEKALEPALATLSLTARAQLQQLDLVTQVLSELADLLDRSIEAVQPRQIGIPRAVVEPVRLGALRARLAGEQALPARSATRGATDPAARLELF
jgi:hypothetical protein